MLEKIELGTQMEKLVEKYIRDLGYNYDCQFSKIAIKKKYDVDLDKPVNDSNFKSDANKKFDFVIKTSKNLYLIETNFYGSSGSKLNETSRSYKSLNQSLKYINSNVKFVWITDGIGWKSAKKNLEEAYNSIEHLYTIEDLDCGILEKIII